MLSHVQLCNLRDCSPPGSSVHWDSLGKNIGMGCHFLLQAPGYLSDPGIKSTSPALADGFFYHCATWEAPVLTPGYSNSTLRYSPKWIENITTKTCTWMFIATLFIIAKTWKQPKYLSVSEWLNKLYFFSTEKEWAIKAIKRHREKFNV